MELRNAMKSDSLFVQSLAVVTTAIACTLFIDDCNCTTSGGPPLNVSFDVTNTTYVVNQVFGPNVSVDFNLCTVGGGGVGSCGDSSKTLALYLKNISFLDGTHVTVRAPATGLSCSVAAPLSLFALELTFGKRCSFLVTGTFCNASYLSISDTRTPTGNPVDLIVSELTLAGSSFNVNNVSVGAFIVAGEALTVVNFSVVTLRNIEMHGTSDLNFVTQLFHQWNVTSYVSYGSSSASASWSLFSMVRVLRIDKSSIVIRDFIMDYPMVWCFGCLAPSGNSSSTGIALSSGWLWFENGVMGVSNVTSSVVMDFSGTTRSSVSLSSNSRIQLSNVTIGRRGGTASDPPAYGGLLINCSDSRSATVSLQDMSMVSLASSQVSVAGGGGLTLLFDRSENSTLVAVGGSFIGGSGIDGFWNCHGPLAACLWVSFINATWGIVSLRDGSTLAIQEQGQIVRCDVALSVDMSFCAYCDVIVDSGSGIAIKDSGTIISNVATAALLISLHSSHHSSLSVSSFSFVGVVHAAGVLLVGAFADGIAILMNGNVTDGVISVTDGSFIGIATDAFLLTPYVALRFDFSYSQMCRMRLRNGGVVGITESSTVYYYSPQRSPLVNISWIYAGNGTLSVEDQSSVTAMGNQSGAVSATTSDTSTPLLLIRFDFSDSIRLAITKGSSVGLSGCQKGSCISPQVASSSNNASAFAVGTAMITLNATLSISFSIYVANNGSVLGMRNSSLVNTNVPLIRIVMTEAHSGNITITEGGTLGVAEASSLSTSFCEVMCVDMSHALSSSLEVTGVGSVAGVRGGSTALSGGSSYVLYFRFWWTEACNVTVSDGGTLGVSEGSSAIGSGSYGRSVLMEGAYSTELRLLVEGPASVFGAMDANRITSVGLSALFSRRFECTIRYGAGLGIFKSAQAMSSDNATAAIVHILFEMTNDLRMSVDGLGSVMGVQDTTCLPTFTSHALTILFEYSSNVHATISNGAIVGAVNSTIGADATSAIYVSAYNSSNVTIHVTGTGTVIGAANLSLPLDRTVATGGGGGGGFLAVVLDVTETNDTRVIIADGGTLGLVRCTATTNVGGAVLLRLGYSSRMNVTIVGTGSLAGVRRSTVVAVGGDEPVVVDCMSSVNATIVVLDGGAIGVIENSSVFIRGALNTNGVIVFTFTYTLHITFIVRNHSCVGVYDNSRVVSTASKAAGVRLLLDHSNSTTFCVADGSVVGVSMQSRAEGKTSGVLTSCQYTQNMTLQIEGRGAVLGVSNGSTIAVFDTSAPNPQSYGLMLYSLYAFNLAMIVRDGGLIGSEHNSTVTAQWYGVAIYVQWCRNCSLILLSGSSIGMRGRGEMYMTVKGYAAATVIYVSFLFSNDCLIRIDNSSAIGMTSDDNSRVDAQGDIYGVRIDIEGSTRTALLVLNNSSIDVRGSQTVVTSASVGLLIFASTGVNISVVVSSGSVIGARNGSTILTAMPILVKCSQCNNVSVVIDDSSVVGYSSTGRQRQWEGGAYFNASVAAVGVDLSSSNKASLTISRGSDVGVYVDTMRNGSSSSSSVSPSLLSQLWVSSQAEIVRVSMASSLDVSLDVRSDSRLGMSTFSSGFFLSGSMVRVDMTNASRATIRAANGSMMGIDARCNSPSGYVFAQAAMFIKVALSSNVTISVQSNASIGISGGRQNQWAFYHPHSDTNVPTFSVVHLNAFNATFTSVDIGGAESFFGVSGGTSLVIDQAVSVNVSQSKSPSVRVSSQAFIGISDTCLVTGYVAVMIDFSGTMNGSLLIVNESCIGMRGGASFSDYLVVNSNRRLGLTIDGSNSAALTVIVANNSVGLGVQSGSSAQLYRMSGSAVAQWYSPNGTGLNISITGSHASLIDISGRASVLGNVAVVVDSATTVVCDRSGSTVDDPTGVMGVSLIRVVNSSQFNGSVVLSQATTTVGSLTTLLRLNMDQANPSISPPAYASVSTAVLIQDTTMGLVSGGTSWSVAAVHIRGRWLITPTEAEEEIQRTVAHPVPSPRLTLVTVRRSVFPAMMSAVVSLNNSVVTANSTTNAALLRILIICSYWAPSSPMKQSTVLVIVGKNVTPIAEVIAVGCTADTTSSSVSATDGRSGTSNLTSAITWSSSNNTNNASFSASLTSRRTATEHGVVESLSASQSLRILSSSHTKTQTSRRHRRSLTLSDMRSSSTVSVIKKSALSMSHVTLTRALTIANHYHSHLSDPEGMKQMRAAVSTSSVVSSLVLPTAALAAQRLTLLANLGACNDLPDVGDVMSAPVDFMNAPLQLRVGVEYGAWHRGAVIGDAAVWVGCVVVGFVLTLVARRAGLGGATAANESIVASAARLRLPGLYFILVALLLQQVVVSSVLLLGYGGGSSSAGGSASNSAADRVIGACGLLLSCVIAGSMARVLDPRRRCFRALAEPAESGSQRRRWPNSVMRWLKAESVEWRPRDEAGDALFVERYGFLFESCSDGRHWWLLVDVLSTLVLGVVSGVVPATVTSCLAEVWFAVSLCAVQLVAVMALRPLNNRLEFGIVVLLYALQLVIALCSALNAAPDVVYVLGIVFSAIAALLAVIDLGDVMRQRVLLSVPRRGGRVASDAAEMAAPVRSSNSSSVILSSLVLLICLRKDVSGKEVGHASYRAMMCVAFPVRKL